MGHFTVKSLIPTLYFDVFRLFKETSSEKCKFLKTGRYLCADKDSGETSSACLPLPWLSKSSLVTAEEEERKRRRRRRREERERNYALNL